MEKQSSQYRGVSFFKPMNRWTATFNVDGRRRVKYFHSEKEAAVGYDLMAVGDKGADAITNFPIEGYDLPEKIKEEERVYDDRQVQINTAFVRNALNGWISKHPVSYRKRRANWVIVVDLFFPDFKEGDDHPFGICKEWGIDPIGTYI